MSGGHFEFFHVGKVEKKEERPQKYEVEESYET